MSEPRRRKRKSSLRRRTIGRMVLSLRAIWWAMLVLAAGVVILAVSRGELLPSITMAARTPTAVPAATPSETTYVPVPTPTPWPTLTPFRPESSPVPKGKRIGILAGHFGPQNDPGAVCPDGLREADINLAVAERVVATLCNQGYDADLLAEFDAALDEYHADAFVSIHSDSCDIPGASGFKVARSQDSAIPEIEDRLVECLYQEYEAATGLVRHESSITPAMHGYHAFRQIALETPGAIIELGFMLADRRILTADPDRPAQGIVNALRCFLE
jgi:N-acetylmuramoyl-L-alanine amidase